MRAFSQKHDTPQTVSSVLARPHTAALELLHRADLVPHSRTEEATRFAHEWRVAGEEAQGISYVCFARGR